MIGYFCRDALNSQQEVRWLAGRRIPEAEFSCEQRSLRVSTQIETATVPPHTNNNAKQTNGFEKKDYYELTVLIVTRLYSN